MGGFVVVVVVWESGCGWGRGGCKEEEGTVVFGAGGGIDEGFVGEGDGVYGGV